MLWLHHSGLLSLCEKGQENPHILATTSLGMLSLQTGDDKMLMPTGIQDRKRIHTAPTNPKVTKFGPKNYHREIALSPLEFHCFPPVRHSTSPYFYFQNDLSSSPPGQSIQITFISIIPIINYFLLINSYNLQLKSGAPQKLSAIYLFIYCANKPISVSGCLQRPTKPNLGPPAACICGVVCSPTSTGKIRASQVTSAG